ncbi:SDR family NAD(P)-dependent oxidoreductase [Halalkalibacter sp. APA_J-10(15)]|uniref:SDR family NAD(P)-dependent oxidoreductase n=1 Tax=Halalkalibacter sp. APA_J-10(15) TaxID=2933805 RepID=UPI001FF255AE|nr:SDR family NAD(P)-dependent oxidoreductase [Halalkalibacter sp. APA_J-10(15)]MCK0471882.1 SDR family NAD(P)-dependent oxidoreductase [Halalkalibacter sp. APA_J-10(15)]
MFKQEDIAVVGISCIAAGAKDYQEFWQKIKEGKSTIEEVKRSSWGTSYFSSNQEQNNKSYAKWVAMISDMYSFDYRFFNISPIEAQELDPQQRLLLEQSVKCIDDSGICMNELQKKVTGVFTGVSAMEFYRQFDLDSTQVTSYTGSGNYQFMLSNRISNFLNLKGESKVIDTGCSASLVALDEAMSALRIGKVDYALVSGVNLFQDETRYVLWSKNRMLSPNGTVSPFSSKANGVIFGEGIGVLLLKPVTSAIRDKDNIHCIIKGSAVNHCGKTPTISSPSVDGQYDVLVRAYDYAQVEPGDITYIETHGTGTALGDPIEFEALRKFFNIGNEGRPKYSLGSVKANIGHTSAASGLLGLIKVILMLKNKKIPPQINFEEANPIIEMDKYGFKIEEELRQWKRYNNKPLSAGVTSIGYGGVNAHVVIQEYENIPLQSTDNEKPFPFLISANSQESLNKMINEWKLFVSNESFKETKIADICKTLMNRQSYKYRIGTLVKNHHDIENFIMNTLHKEKNNSENKKLLIDEIFTDVESTNKLFEGIPELKVEYESILLSLQKDDVLQKYIEKLKSNSLHEENKELYLFLQSLAFVYFLKGVGLEYKTVTGAKNGFLLSLIIVGIIQLEDGIKILINEREFEEVVLHTPTINYFDIYSNQTYKNCVINQSYFMYVLNFKVSQNLWTFLVEKTNKLFEQNYSFKKCLENWLTPLQQHNINFWPILQGSVRTEENIKKLLVIAMISALEQLYMKWNIQLENDEINDNMKEVISLIHAGIITIKDLISIILNEADEIKKTIEKVNKIDAISHIESFPIMKTYSTINATTFSSSYRYCKLEKDPLEVDDKVNKEFVLFSSLIQSREKMVEKLLELWKNNHYQIKFKQLINDIQYKKISLPTYQFQKDEITYFEAKSKKVSLPETPYSLEESLSYLTAKWEKKDLPLANYKLGRNLIILFDSNYKCYDSLKAKGEHVILVFKGNRYNKLNKDIYSINYENGKDYYKLFQDITTLHEGKTQTIIYKWQENAEGTVSTDRNDLNAFIKSVYLPLFRILKTNGLKNSFEDTKLLYVFEGSEYSYPIRNSIQASLRTIKQEYTNIQVKSILLDHQYETSEDYIEWQCQMIIKEIYSWTAEIEVKYINNERYTKTLEEENLNSWSSTNKFSGKTVVVFGGMSKLAIILAKWLFQNGSTVVLSSRRRLEEAKNTLKEHGLEVDYYSADINRGEQIRKVIERTEKKYGTIEAVFNCAGITKDKLVINKQEEELMKVIESKTFGVCNLCEIAREYKISEVIIYSSIAGVIGNVGQFDYAFANSFISNYVESLNHDEASSTKFTSIHWGYWKNGGMQLNDIEQDQLFEKNGLIPIEDQEAIEALAKILHSNHRSISVAKFNPNRIKEVFLNNDYLHHRNIISDSGTSMPIVIQKETVEEVVKEAINEIFGISKEQIQLEEEISALGFNSILITQLMNIVGNKLNIKNIPVTIFFTFKHLIDFVNYIINNYSSEIQVNVSTPYSNHALGEKEGENKEDEEFTEYKVDISPEVAATREEELAPDSEDEIAIIGISGEYPHSKNISEFWDNIKMGKNCISQVPIDRWDWEEYYHPSKAAAFEGYIYCKEGGFLDEIYNFDNSLFNITPREAKLMDPQERRFLQIAWEALEDSGYNKNRMQTKYKSNVGVFIGCTSTTYDYFGIESWKESRGDMTHSMMWSIANRVSYYFDLKGPSMAVDTACSSSLTALHLACKSLKYDECKMAIVGGVNLYTHPAKYLLLCQKQMLSMNGKCSTFSENADGFVPGEGIGAIILKPLKEAVKDRDNIHAVIKSTTINHGGKTSGYHVPNLKAQQELISRSLETAKLNARDITHIEAHGTGTVLGDPIEVSAIEAAFSEQTDDKGFCAISSVKSNIGHLESAAGIAGVTKSILELKHKQLAPSINITTINERIDLTNSPINIQTELGSWDLEDDVDKRRVVVSSFGAGGVNCNVVLEEYAKGINTQENEPNIFVLSAKSHEQLKQYTDKFMSFLKGKTSIDRGLSIEMRKSIEEKVLNIISCILSIPVEEIKSELTLLTLGLSRFQVAQLQDMIKKEFNIKISTSELMNLYDVNELVKVIQDTSTHISKPPYEEINIQDLCFTLQVGRESMEYRLAAVVEEIEEIIQILDMFQAQNYNPTFFYGKKERNFEICSTEINKVASDWVEGGNIDWEKQYTGKLPAIISLPTYPFDELEYRYYDRHDSDAKLVEDEKNVTQLEHLYNIELEEVTLEKDVTFVSNSVKHTIIIYTQNTDSQIKQLLESENITRGAFFIELGDVEGKIGYNSFRINVNEENSLYRILSTIPQIERIIIVGDCTMSRGINEIVEYEEEMKYGVMPTLRIIKAIASLDVLEKNISINLVTESYKASNSIFFSAARGLLKAAMKEYYSWNINTFEFDKVDETNIQLLFSSFPSNNYLVKTNKIFVEKLKRIDIEKQLKNKVDSKAKGVYVLLGGTGRIGSEYAYHLAKEPNVKIVLIGKSEENQRIKGQIKKIEELGGEAIYYQADISDYKDMKKVFSLISITFGKITAVVHSAMYFTSGLISNLDEKIYKKMLDTKVKSAVILNQILKAYDIEYLLYFSSGDSFGALLGHGAYVSACQCQDKYVLNHCLDNGYDVKIINWGFWTLSHEQLEKLNEKGEDHVIAYMDGLKSRGIEPIDTVLGMSAIKQSLENNYPQLFVMNVDSSVIDNLNGINR